jgi:16S rRNA C1402 (ribose-2'-O) methylase RsmI
LHEEFLRGTLSEVIHQVADGDIKGEFTIMVRSSEGESQISQERLLTEIERLQREGMGVKQIAELLGEVHSISKREVYRLVISAKAVERDR